MTAGSFPVDIGYITVDIGTGKSISTTMVLPRDATPWTEKDDSQNFRPKDYENIFRCGSRAYVKEVIPKVIEHSRLIKEMGERN